MHIILRKVGGRFEALFSRDGRPATFAATSGAQLMPGRLLAFLTSPMAIGLVLIALAMLWLVTHPVTAAQQTMFGAMAGSVTTIREKKEKRATLITSARSILDKAETEKRELSAEERTSYDKHLEDEKRLSDSIKLEERQLELERSLAGDSLPETRAATPPAATGERPDARAAALQSTEYRSLYNRWLMEGRDAFAGANEAERRALDATGGPSGGFLQAPIQMAQELVKFMDNLTFIRQRATKVPVTTAKALGIVSLDNDPADADWTAEIATGGEDSSMSFGNREMVPNPSAKLIKISNKLLRATAQGAETLVRERLGYKFGITEEKAFLTGSGVGQPLGVFVASTSGIDTSRDVSTGNTATTITFDGLIEAKYSLKAQYRKTAAWAMSRALVNQASKLKDGNGQYIWKLSVRDGEPDSILGFPYFESEYVPNTFTTGQYVGILGEWSYYWIADALTLEIQRLVELFAGTNQTGFIGRMELDAQPVLAEAFARIKLA